MSLENPQLEDGFLMIVNSIAEALARTQFSGYEWRVLWFLWRKTYGWRKKSDLIPLSQFVEGTGICKQHVSRAINRLVERGVIFKTGTKIGTRQPGEYEFNKHFMEWKQVPKLVTAVQPLPKLVTQPLPKLGTSKYRSTSKEKYSPISPQIRKAKDKGTDPQVLEVLAYLNLKIGSKYSVAPDLVARFRQGATVEQAKAIIDKKVAEWAGTEMAPWLKPSTLFCKKHFDEYLNQPAIPTAIPLSVPIPIWTPEEDAEDKRKAREWLYDDKAKEDAR